MFEYILEQMEDGQWRVIIRSLGNHEELMRSVDDAYTRIDSAEHLVELLKKGGLDLVPADGEHAQAVHDRFGPDDGE